MWKINIMFFGAEGLFFLLGFWTGNRALAVFCIVVLGVFALAFNTLRVVRNSPQYGMFARELTKMDSQCRSIECRESVVEEITDFHVLEAIGVIKESIERKHKKANRLISAYDPVTKPKGSRERIEKLILECDGLIAKYNELLDNVLSVDTEVDTGYVDDLIESLKEMNNYE